MRQFKKKSGMKKGKAIAESKSKQLLLELNGAEKRFCRVFDDKFDVDNSGAISKDELILALNRWNFSHTEDEIDIYAVYAGEDGMMDYSEFLTFITGGTKKWKTLKRARDPGIADLLVICKMMEKLHRRRI